VKENFFAKEKDVKINSKFDTEEKNSRKKILKKRKNMKYTGWLEMKRTRVKQTRESN
jgi:hypothetical protein